MGVLNRSVSARLQMLSMPCAETPLPDTRPIKARLRKLAVSGGASGRMLSGLPVTRRTRLHRVTRSRHVTADTGRAHIRQDASHRAAPAGRQALTVTNSYRGASRRVTLSLGETARQQGILFSRGRVARPARTGLNPHMAAGQLWLFDPTKPFVERLGDDLFRALPSGPGV
jgi:hypothetical protein